jgi:hypothetical protein
MVDGGTLWGAAVAFVVSRGSGLAEDPVEVGAADRADGLGHPGALVDSDKVPSRSETRSATEAAVLLIRLTAASIAAF